MKSRVDPKLCQGHTLCQMAAAEFFKLSDVDGHAYAPDEDVPPEMEENVRLAAAGCPEQAIIVLDD